MTAAQWMAPEPSAEAAMYQRILVPFDGSSISALALDEAIGLARSCGASIRLVHVIDDLVMANGFETFAAYREDVVPRVKRAAEAVLAAGRERLDCSGVSFDAALVDEVGARVADLILQQATVWNADLIVAGTHGRRGFERWVVGSEAEHLVRRAEVPVLLVRSKPGNEAAPGEVLVPQARSHAA